MTDAFFVSREQITAAERAMLDHRGKTSFESLAVVMHTVRYKELLFQNPIVFDGKFLKYKLMYSPEQP